MSTNYEHNGEDDTLAARRTAHALGQTSGDDWAAVEAEMAASPKARQEVEAIAAVAQRLKEAAETTPPAVRSPELRAALEARLTALESAARPLVRGPVPQWRRRVVTWVLTAGCLAGVAVALMQQSNFFGGPRQFAKTESATGAAADIRSSTKVQVQGDYDAARKSLSSRVPKAEQHYEEAPIVAGIPHEIGPNERPALQVPSGDSFSVLKNPVPAAPREPATVAGLEGGKSSSPFRDANGIQNGGDRQGGGAAGSTSAEREERSDNQSMAREETKPGQSNHAATPARSKDGNGEEPAAGETGSNLVLNIQQSQVLGEGERGDNSGAPMGRKPPAESGRATLDEPPIVYPNSESWKEMSHRRKEKYAVGGDGASGPLSGPGLVNPVQVETLPGMDAMVIKGSPADVAKVDQYVKQAEQERNRRYEEGPHAPAAEKPLPEDPLARQQMLQGIVDGQEPLLVPGARKSPTYARVRAELEASKHPGTSDDQSVTLRGQYAVNVAGEYQRELQKLKQEESELQKKVDSQNQLPTGAPNPLSVADQEKARAELRIAHEQIAAFESEMARLDVKSSPAKSNPKPEAKPQSKPLETWKPARVVPNASRLMVGEKEELPLKGMQVDVRVDGFRARVLLDLYYFNDRPQQLEGNFQLRLPDEAAPYFFAFGKTVYQAPQVTASDSMFFKPQEVSLGDTTPEKILALRGNSWEQPKVARMVPKEKAAMAYRDTVRRRIDPALVEWSGAGVFQCRVFPLAPQSLHRITIGYDVDLVRVGDDLELRLDLPEWQSGDVAPATVVDLNVAAADARQVSLEQKSEVRSQKSEGGNANGHADQTALTPSPDGSGTRFSYRLVDPKQRPLTLRLRKPGTLMLTGNDEATGNYFATRVTLPLPETFASGKAGHNSLTPGPSPSGRGETAGDRAKQAVFLVDTSLGAGPQFPLWTKMLRATLTNNRDQIKQFAVLFFNVETFWWQEKYIDNTPENVDAVLNYADNLALEGATDLGRALTEVAAPKWRKAEDGAAPDLFLLSDGAATWGEDRWGLLAASITGKPKAGRTTLTPSPSPKGRGESSSCAVRLSHRAGWRRLAVAGLSGRADRRGCVLARR